MERHISQGVYVSIKTNFVTPLVTPTLVTIKLIATVYRQYISGIACMNSLSEQQACIIHPIYSKTNWEEVYSDTAEKTQRDSVSKLL